MKSTIKKHLIHSLALFFICLNISCKKDFTRKKYGIFNVIDSSTIEMKGIIKSKSLKNFNKLIKKYPNITLINIKNCDGSLDDETNLKLSLKVHEKNINIHLMDNGSISSGGVDFFLSGIKRNKGSNTKIGVHSWSDGSNSATDYAIGHSNHLPYIEYYKNIGFSQEDAENFYYFTINAATANSIHWMTENEISQYNILK